MQINKITAIYHTYCRIPLKENVNAHSGINSSLKCKVNKDNVYISIKTHLRQNLFFIREGSKGRFGNCIYFFFSPVSFVLFKNILIQNKLTNIFITKHMDDFVLYVISVSGLEFQY